ncbi:histone-lysine N-methyltransferase SETMAR [Trichonephila clavipes]|nr:histone-lysine N-methyltransferase SETMAR [Trichonephila clavipes]
MTLVVLHRSCEKIVLVLRSVRATVIARRLKKWSRTEVRTVIRFLWNKNVSPFDMRIQIVEVYGDEAMCRQQVAKWRRSFETGIKHVENCYMEASGASYSSPNSGITAEVYGGVTP